MVPTSGYCRGLLLETTVSNLMGNRFPIPRLPKLFGGKGFRIQTILIQKGSKGEIIIMGNARIPYSPCRICRSDDLPLLSIMEKSF